MPVRVQAVQCLRLGLLLAGRYHDAMRRHLPIALVAAFISTAAAAADLTGPDPSLTPEQVARIQVEALGRNDEPYPDKGIEITWNFASLGNKHVTGPLRRFTRMVHDPVYEPMVNHRGAQYENVRIEGDTARLDVILLSKEGRFVGYRFTLSRQKGGPCDGCWMTDAVARFQVTVH